MKTVTNDESELDLNVAENIFFESMCGWKSCDNPTMSTKRRSSQRERDRGDAKPGL